MVIAGPRVYFAMARDGALRGVGRARAPALPHAGARDRRAGASGAACSCSRARSRSSSATPASRSCSSPASRCRAVRAATAARGRPAAVPRAGLSVGARDLRRRERAHRGNEIWRNAGTAAAGLADHRGGRADLRPAAPTSGERQHGQRAVARGEQQERGRRVADERGRRRTPAPPAPFERRDPSPTCTSGRGDRIAPRQVVARADGEQEQARSGPEKMRRVRGAARRTRARQEVRVRAAARRPTSAVVDERDRRRSMRMSPAETDANPKTPLPDPNRRLGLASVHANRRWSADPLEISLERRGLARRDRDVELDAARSRRPSPRRDGGRPSSGSPGRRRRYSSTGADE